MGKRIILIFFLMCLWGSSKATGQSQIDFFTAPDSGTIKINSDKLIAFNKENRVVFKGSVHVTKGNMLINCDELEVFYDKNTEVPKGDSKLNRLIAKGNVKISQEDKVATCGKAFLDNDKQTLTLLDNPKVWQGKDFMSGQKIVVYLEEGKGEIEGHDENPVEVIIYSTKPPSGDASVK